MCNILHSGCQKVMEEDIASCLLGLELDLLSIQRYERRSISYDQHHQLLVDDYNTHHLDLNLVHIQTMQEQMQHVEEILLIEQQVELEEQPGDSSGIPDQMLAREANVRRLIGELAHLPHGVQKVDEVELLKHANEEVSCQHHVVHVDDDEEQKLWLVLIVQLGHQDLELPELVNQLQDFLLLVMQQALLLLLVVCDVHLGADEDVLQRLVQIDEGKVQDLAHDAELKVDCGIT